MRVEAGAAALAALLGDAVYFVLNQKIEHTNVCVLSCKFCDFAAKKGDPDAYEMTTEEILAKLRQVDVLVSQGQAVADAVRSIGVTEVTYYRWRQEFGGLKIDQIRRLKDLEVENARLRRAVSDLTLDKMILAWREKCLGFTRAHNIDR